MKKIMCFILVFEALFLFSARGDCQARCPK